MKRRWSNISYATKLWICFFLFVCILMGLFSYSLYRSYRKAGLNTMQEYNQKLTNQIVRNYEMIDDSIVNLLSQKYSQPSVVKMIYQNEIPDFERNAALSELGKEVSSYPMYHSALLYNNQANKISPIGISEARVPDVIANFYKGNEIPAMQTVPVMVTKLDGSKELVFSYYAFEYVTNAGVMTGAMVLNIETRWIKELIEYPDGKDIHFMIVDQDGRVILDNKNDNLFRTSLERDYLTSVLAEHEGMTFETKVDGKKQLVTTQKISKTDWTLICEQPFAVKYQELIRPIQINTIWVLLALLALALLGTVLLSRYIYRPVHNLVLHAQTLSTDAFHGDEFSYLTRVLCSNTAQSSQMEEMRKSIAEIKKQNYFKLLLENGSLQEDDAQEFRECAAYVGSGIFFAILLKVPDLSVKLNGITECWESWAKHLFPSFELVPMNEHEMMVLIKEEGSVNLLRERFLKEYTEFQKTVLEKEKIPVSIFVTDYCEYGKVNQLYTEAQQIKKYELMYSVGCCLTTEIIHNNHDVDDVAYPVSAANHLLRVLRSGEMEKTEEAFDDFISKILRNDADNFRISLMRIALSIENLYEEMNVHKDPAVYTEMGRLVKEVAGLSSLEETQQCFNALFCLVCRQKDSVAEGKTRHSALIRSVEDYILGSFADPNLNLEQTAEVFKMSPNYLGKLFKDEMNLSVSNYITAVRLNRSLVLLNDTDYSIKEIIEQIGFINESSFYKQFKKQFGITPKEYRVNRVLVENIRKKDTI